MNLYNGAAALVGGEPSGFDMRIDQCPLAQPVGPDTIVTMHVAAFHPIGPYDVGVHRGQRRIDVAGVERGVGLRKKVVVSGHCGIMPSRRFPEIPLARIFHQNAALWQRTGRDRPGSADAANRSFYWQGARDSVSRRVVRAGARGLRLGLWNRVAMVRFRPKLAPAGKRPHARYGYGGGRDDTGQAITCSS